MSDGSHDLSQLSPQEQRALLAALLRKQASTPKTFPLSFAQQRLWFLDQLEPASPAYNMFAAVRIRGLLDITILEQSLNAVVRRHEALRTTFTGYPQGAAPALNGQPVQAIAQQVHIALGSTDLTTLPVAEHEAEVQRRAAEAARQPFDLVHGPLLRAQVLRLGPSEHVLLLTIHHIVADGWSISVLVNEIGSMYPALASEQPLPLPPLPIQYADYSVWQRQWLAGAQHERLLRYWRQQLADAPPVLSLPTDYQRPPIQTFHGAAHTFEIPAPLQAALQPLSQKAGATLFMTLLAAFKVLLYRYTGQTDLLVGTVVANRPRTELEPLIGFFVNMLVLRSKLDGQVPSGCTFRDVLARVRETTLQAYAHQDLPFELLVEDLHPPRDLSYHPLFQVLCVLQNTPPETRELAGLSWEPIAMESGIALFDLALVCEEHGDQLRGRLEYRTDLFAPTTIARLVEHYQTLLAAVVAQPDRPVTALEFLPDTELRRLHTWGAAVSPALPAESVVQRFEAQVERTPEQVAVDAGHENSTYAALNQAANHLAHYLRSVGVGPEVRVGVCLDRSPLLAIVVLAIFKAGGAFVPLDPTNPVARLRYLLADAQVAVLLTQQDVVSNLELADHAQPPHILCLDRDWSTIETFPATNPAIPVRPETLAYIIYTSGTTGQPKGVMVEQGNLASTLLISVAEFPFTAGDVMPCLAAYSFDIFLFELLTPLLTGGTVRIVTRAELLDAATCLEIVQNSTLVHTVPSLMQQVLSWIAASRNALDFTQLRAIFIGGDAVPGELITAMQQTFPTTNIHILYGPTEGTIICAHHPVRAGDPRDRQLIGRALPGAVLRIYDPHGNLAPISIPGELYLGGAAVTRGYLDREALTHEKYVNLDGLRWYRTGDLVRYLADGTIEFLGRIDQQVKIRGYRIELGEIEATLAQHPAIQSAVVSAYTDAAKEQQLVAYLVTRVGEQLTVGELQQALTQTLPSYMIPAAFVFLDSLPLNEHGKVDRTKLPAPSTERPTLDVPFEMPRTADELAIAAIWRELLDVERIGIHDNFFQLGGHSLLAVQVLARIKAYSTVDLPPRTIFATPTIAGLAEQVETARWATQSLEAANTSDDNDREEGEV